MARGQRSLGDLQALSEHLHYEHVMLLRIAQSLASGALGQSALSNAALESFVIHCRVLKDFLYVDSPKYSDDVIAQDFFPTDVEWRVIRPPLTSSLELIEEKTGKEVVHLTNKRLGVKFEDKPWPFVEIVRDLQLALDQFLKAVPADHIHPCWRS